MKLFLIAALLVLALTGSSTHDGVDRISQYIENIKAKINQDIHEVVGNQELKDHAHSFLEDKQTELAAKIQDQLGDLKAVAANMEDQIKPLAENVKERVNPLILSLQQKMEGVLQTLAEHAKAGRK